MATYFISDLHLSPEHPDLTRLFSNFLHRYASKADAVYILGDLFEVWIGDDDLNEFNQSILFAFQQITNSKIPFYFMPGNRDFLLGKNFLRRAGIKLLAEPSIIDLYGEKILLMHGDSLCTRDYRHQQARKILRNPILQKIFLKLPLFLRHKIAEKIRDASAKRGQQLSVLEMDVPIELIPSLLQKYSVNLLIHGHTHRPSIEYFYSKDQISSRIVLSDWNNRGNMLVCDKNGAKRLLYFAVES